MESEEITCRICGEVIPKRRLEAMPETSVCIECSEKIGGEYELEVKISGTGKAGSLKMTGQDVQVKRKPKSVR